MIGRFVSLLLLAYALGFVLFAVTLVPPAGPDSPKADAAVVLTGGSGRIERGLETVREGKARRLLVAGADPSVTKSDLARTLGGGRSVLRCCVDLGSESVDTQSNAEEAQRWLDRRRYKSLRLITSDWHMHRAGYEFRKVLGRDYEIIPDAVRSEPSFLTLFCEYNKYVLRRLAVLFDI